MPRSALAAMTHSQLGAQMIMNGTGRPASQPRIRTRLRPQESPRVPDTRLAHAFTTPKLTMKETTSVVEPTLNSSAPIRGTTVLSMPTMPPTKALMRTSRANCGQFSLRPSLIPPSEPLEPDTALGSRNRPPGISGAKAGGLRWRGRNVLQHEADEFTLIVNSKRLVVPPLESERRCGIGAQASAADRSGIGARKNFEIIRER